MISCPHCRFSNQPAAKFCSGCGRELPASAPAPAPEPTKPSRTSGSPPAPAAEPKPVTPASTKPAIRVVLAKTPPPAPEVEESESDKIPPTTALVLGLIILLTMIFATMPTMVFLLLAAGLVLLHRELLHNDTPLAAYAATGIRRGEDLLARFTKPDGTIILSMFLGAVLLVLVPKIAFGILGAAAIVIALYLLDLLGQPAMTAWHGLDTHASRWAERLRPILDHPRRCHLLAVLCLFPVTLYLVEVFLPVPTRWPAYARMGLAAGAVLAVAVWTKLVESRGRSEKERTILLDRGTFLVATLALVLGVVCTMIQVAARLRFPFLADGVAWNGVWLAVVPVIALGAWTRGLLGRWPVAKGVDPAWRLASLGTFIMLLTGTILWRALRLEGPEAANYGGGGLFAAVVAVWFLLVLLLLRLVQEDSPNSLPEWAVVYLAIMVSLILCFFMVQFGGGWGLALAILPIAAVWKDAAYVMRRSQNPADAPSETTPPA